MSSSSASSASKPRRLGRGLSALLNENPPVAVPIPSQIAPPPTTAPPAPTPQRAESSGGPAPSNGAPAMQQPDRSRYAMIPVASFTPNRWQPRRSFDEAQLKGLADSIKVSGMMQPIVARRAQDGLTFEIIAGERRWRAAKMLNLASAPTIVVALTDQEAAEWALVENMQREDLNALDRARALGALTEQFGLTQSQIADRTGLDRSTVANILRTLELEPPILDLIESGAISAGHARSLASAPRGRVRVELAQHAAAAKWSVRRLESAVRAALRAVKTGEAPPAVKNNEPSESVQAGIRALERDIAEALGTRVKITTDRSGKKGRVMIDFYDLDQFDGLLQKFGVTPS